MSEQPNDKHVCPTPVAKESYTGMIIFMLFALIAMISILAMGVGDIKGELRSISKADPLSSYSLNPLEPDFILDVREAHKKVCYMEMYSYTIQQRVDSKTDSAITIDQPNDLTGDPLFTNSSSEFVSKPCSEVSKNTMALSEQDTNAKFDICFLQFWEYENTEVNPIEVASKGDFERLGNEWKDEFAIAGSQMFAQPCSQSSSDGSGKHASATFGMSGSMGNGKVAK